LATGREPDGENDLSARRVFQKSPQDGRSDCALPAARDLWREIFTAEGGLVSAQSSRISSAAAGYVDRSRGEKPADLPVQQPVQFQFVLNLKAAKALGHDVPTSIALRADEA
jgi:hypothetical protein